jgi:hypothetical protein
MQNLFIIECYVTLTCVGGINFGAAIAVFQFTPTVCKMDGTARTLFQGMVCCLAILFKRFLTIKNKKIKNPN